MMRPSSEPSPDSALHPVLLAQLRVLGLTTRFPAPEGWQALLQHVSDAYFARDAAAGATMLRGDVLVDDDFHLFAGSADAILIFEPDTERIITANPRACDLYGYSLEGLAGLSMRSLSASSSPNRAHIDAVLEDSAATPDGWVHFDTSQRRRDGSVIMVAVQARPFRYHGARAILTINRDLTDLKRTQRALVLSDERFAYIFNASPVAAAVMDGDGIILSANKAILSLFDLTAESAIGRSVFDLEIRVGDDTRRLERLPRPPLRDYEMQLTSATEGDRVMLVSSEWLELGDDRHILLQMIDITGRKQAEAELRESEIRTRSLLMNVERQAREAALLHQVRTIMARENNLQTIVRAVVQGIRDYFGYDLISVYFKMGDTLVLQHEVGYANTLTPIPLASGVMARAVRAGEPILLEDVSRDPGFLAAAPGIRSEVSVPLFVSGVAEGVLNIETVDEPLTEHDLDLFIALGAHLSLAIQRARLFDALQMSNDRYDTLLRSVQEVVFQVDATGHWTYLNPAWERQSGYSIEETLGRYWLDFLHPDDRFKLQMRFARLIRRHETYYSMRARFVSREGQDRWCELTGRLNYSDDGVYMGTAGTAADQTERFNAEQREREQHQLAEALVANAAALSVAESTEAALRGAITHIQRVIPNFDGLRVALIDQGMAHMVAYPLAGLPPEALAEARTWELEEAQLPLIDADDALIGAHSMTGLAENALNLPGLEWVRSVLVAPLRSTNGLPGYLYLDSASPAAFNDAQAQWIQGFADQLGTALHNLRLRADVVRHARELELRVADRTGQYRQAKEQVEAILNTSSDPIALITVSGDILQANRAFQQAFGVTKDAGETLPPIPALIEDSAGLAIHTAIKAAATGAKEHHKVTIRRNDGTTFPADVAINPLLDADGTARSAVFSLHDISEYQNLADSLRAALEQERRLVELKSRFGMMVSHEFRTPLASIQTSTDLLQTYHGRLTDERRGEVLSTISRQVRHLSGMLDDILSISKADTVGMDFNPAATDLMELCQSLVDEARWLDHERHRINLSFAAGVIARPVLDQALLRRALTNLLANALKYSPDESVVEFSVRQERDQIIMVIRDEGIGIPESELPRLFDSFFRASNVGNIPGTGLGLAIACRAVEAHGGEISVASDQGHGAAFTLVLPARPD